MISIPLSLLMDSFIPFLLSSYTPPSFLSGLCFLGMSFLVASRFAFLSLHPGLSLLLISGGFLKRQVLSGLRMISWSSWWSTPGDRCHRRELERPDDRWTCVERIEILLLLPFLLSRQGKEGLRRFHSMGQNLRGQTGCESC